MLGVTLIVLVIAQPADDPSTAAFARAAHGVLGREANIEIQNLASDPPDEESVAKAANADGVVELTWAADGTKARVHCYLSREERWVDREVSFGQSLASPEREASERGRLLGLAVATMFTDDAEPEPPAVPPTPSAVTKPTPHSDNHAERSAPSHVPLGRSVEFGGVASSGLHGTAAGIGATAGLRLRLDGPLWARLFATARTGNIPAAQASVRTVLFGGGVAFAALPDSARFALGARVDAFACYFDATHLSEDDIVPDRRARWLGGGDLVAEAGLHFARGAGLFAGGGLEAVSGRTDVYTHGMRVASVPPFRAVGEFGFRAQF